jgi:ATP-binding cassette subfamily B protein
MAGMMLVQGLVPPLSLWLVKSVVDAIASGNDDLGRGAVLVFLWAAAALVGELFAQWMLLVQASLNERLVAYVELLLMRKANDLPDLSAFEDPTFYDDLQTLTNQAAYRPLNLMVTTTTLLPSVVSSVGLMVLLGSIAWWIPLILVAATLPMAYANFRLQQGSWQTTLDKGPLTKAMRYFASIATSHEHATEVRLFGLGPYLQQKYESAYEQLRRETTRARVKQAPQPVAASVAFVGVIVLVFWWVVDRALAGLLTPGDVVLLLQGLASLQGQLGSVVAMFSVLAGHLLFFDKLFVFLDYRSPMPLADPGVPTPQPLKKGIVFEEVSYRYPNGKPALRSVNLQITPGECVALVGENGAGKTTLVKLLCRLYDPTSGTIRADDTDLRDLDLDRWRRSIGAIFQDFGRYDLTVFENIALGRLRDSGDLDGPPRNIQRAAKQAGLDPHVQELPDGYETQLGPEFGGVNLSGGQWQALGIARALVRDAQILILDEPTSGLDPRAEYTLFRRFRELAKGRTTLLVTHRLASVRMADRIVVLKDGLVIEQGSHEELLRLDGEYAALFRMQAEHYGSAIVGS